MWTRKVNHSNVKIIIEKKPPSNEKKNKTKCIKTFPIQKKVIIFKMS
jgi:hypothetical protein